MSNASFPDPTQTEKKQAAFPTVATLQMARAIFGLDLPEKEKAVLGILATNIDKHDGTAWASREALARGARIKDLSNVTRITRSLLAKGFLQRHAPSNAHHSTIYTVNVEMVLSCTGIPASMLREADSLRHTKNGVAQTTHGCNPDYTRTGVILDEKTLPRVSSGLHPKAFKAERSEALRASPKVLQSSASQRHRPPADAPAEGAASDPTTASKAGKRQQAQQGEGHRPSTPPRAQPLEPSPVIDPEELERERAAKAERAAQDAGRAYRAATERAAARKRARANGVAAH